MSDATAALTVGQARTRYFADAGFPADAAMRRSS
jgi:hypothetical protein